MPPVPLPLTPAGAAGQVLAGQDGGAVVRRSVLPGGVRVLSETMPSLRSATIGCWVGVGSRDEADGHHGSTHFLEHLLFKGTARRSAMDIASALDAVGGEANAVTGKEHTCYYARVLDDDLDLAVDVLLDMVTSARLTDEDVESERGVILEELAMNDDDPSDVVHERFVELVMGKHPLGRPIGGTPVTIEAVGRQHILYHYRHHYAAPTLVLTAAGGIDHQELCERVSRELARSEWALPEAALPAARRHNGEAAAVSTADPVSTARRLVVNRPIEQANVVLGCTGLTATDERRHAMTLLNAVLGGGMSSRLFQEIRERRGMAYSVYSFASGYSDAGYFGLYAGCAPSRLGEVVELLAAGLDELAADGVTDEELVRAQGQICGSLVLGLEDSGSRMSRLGKAELVQGEYLPLDDALERIRTVTPEQIQALAADLACRPRSVAVVGPFADDTALPQV